MTTAYNLRVLYNNAADRAVVTATQTAGNLVPANLQTDIKSEVWRSTSTSASVIATWTSSEPVNAAVFPFATFTSTATMRVKCYSDAAGSTLIYDSGAVLCSPSSLQGYSQDWGIIPFGVNAYSYGGSAAGVVYFPTQTVQRMVIDIVDTAQSLGYIEAGRLVIGAYWSPVYNAAYGAVKMSIGETSKNERSDAGDLRTDRGVMYKTMHIDLSVMPAADRDHMYRIARGNGMYRPMWISVSPENTDTMEEQIFSIFGKITKQSDITYTYLNQFNASIDVEEI